MLIIPNTSDVDSLLTSRLLINSGSSSRCHLPHLRSWLLAWFHVSTVIDP